MPSLVCCTDCEFGHPDVLCDGNLRTVDGKRIRNRHPASYGGHKRSCETFMPKVPFDYEGFLRERQRPVPESGRYAFPCAICGEFIEGGPSLGAIYFLHKYRIGCRACGGLEG